MSGGELSFAYKKVDYFLHDLQEKINENDNGDHISEDCLELIRTAQKIIETAGKLMKAIEWRYDDDTGDDDLMEEIGKILGGVV